MKSSKARVPAARTRATRVPVLEVDEEHEHGHRAQPLSLYPLDFETALKALLAVKWPMEKKKKKKRG